MDLRYYLRGLGIGIIVTAVIMGIISRGKQEPLDNEEIKARAQELGMVEGAGVLSDMETEEQNAAEAPDAEAQQRDPSSTKEATEEEEGVAMDSADGVNSDADSSGTDNPDEDTAEEDSSQKSNAQESNAQESNAQESNAQESGEENEQPSPEPDREEAPEPKAQEPEGGGEEAGGAEDPQQDMETASGDETDAESEDSVTIEIVSGEGSFSVCTKLEKAGLIASASSFDRYLYDKGYDRKLRIGIHEIPADAKPEEIAEIVAFGGH